SRGAWRISLQRVYRRITYGFIFVENQLGEQWNHGFRFCSRITSTDEPDNERAILTLGVLEKIDKQRPAGSGVQRPQCHDRCLLKEPALVTPRQLRSIVEGRPGEGAHVRQCLHGGSAVLGVPVLQGGAQNLEGGTTSTPRIDTP